MHAANRIMTPCKGIAPCSQCAAFCCKGYLNIFSKLEGSWDQTRDVLSVISLATLQGVARGAGEDNGVVPGIQEA